MGIQIPWTILSFWHFKTTYICKIWIPWKLQQLCNYLCDWWRQSVLPNVFISQTEIYFLWLLSIKERYNLCLWTRKKICMFVLRIKYIWVY